MNKTQTGNGTCNQTFTLDFMDNYFKSRASALKGVLTRRKHAGHGKESKWRWNNENHDRMIEIQAIEDLRKHFKGQFTDA